MKILVVGGGPGGLFFSVLAKRQNPGHEIHVLEQNPEGATYGWGVVFTESAVRVLRADAPDIVDRLVGTQDWGDRMHVVTRGVTVSLDGFTFYRIGRADLLSVLEQKAVEAGVKVAHDQQVEQLPADDYDLVVGADGVNSTVRELLGEAVEPAVRQSVNWWAWYGTEQLFPEVSLIFQESPHGLFMGHAYAYSPDRSGFVVEVAPRVFERAGLGGLGEEGSQAFCTEVFAPYLGGHQLLSNRSLWFQPKFVTCRRWSSGNVVLLGDALHTVHPSIGSGTRFAMRDGAALAHALERFPDDPLPAIVEYEATRRPTADAFQHAAMRSIAWYEGLTDRKLAEPEMLAIEYAMRTGRVQWNIFRRRNPGLAAIFEHPTTLTSR